MARVLALVPDLMFASRVDATLSAAGHDVQVAESIDAIGREDADLIVADLGEVDPGGVVDRGLPVLGFYSHVDVETRRRAELGGIDLVVPRSRMAREMPELVAAVLESG